MKIKWFGHSCFYIESNGSSIVIDPYNYEDIPGLKPYEVSADLVLVTHEHHDHNYRQGVSLSNRECNLTIRTLDAYHDDQKGALRGPMKLFLITDGTYSVAHLGDLGHPLSDEYIEILKNVDVLMINVGGFLASEAEFANSIVEKIHPGLILPSHFRGNGFGFPNSGTVEEFVALRSDAIYLDTNEFEVYKNDRTNTIILTL